MTNRILNALLLSLLIVEAGCNAGHGVQAQSQSAARPDTSINAVSAFNNRFLDSGTLETFIANEVPADSVAASMRHFYASRNYSFAWFDDEGLSVQAQGFWNAHRHAKPLAAESAAGEHQLHATIDTLLSSDSAYVLSQSELVHTELLFTRHLFTYVSSAYGTRVSPASVQWHIPRRKLEPQALLDSLLNSNKGEWTPLGKSFPALRDELLRYRQIAQQGGWPRIEIKKERLKQGDRHPIIPAVKRRLQLVGLYAQVHDTTNLYSHELEAAIKNGQRAFGLAEDGIIDAALLQAFNVPVEQRIRQMLINLERMKWMPPLPSAYLLANIPEYRLHVVANGQEALTMNIVVGKAANKTVIFSDELKYIVFSPYWNVPRSIVRKEIYPAMRRSRSYLRRHNMEVTGYSGGLPVVRQKPGRSNALGRVKFIFPNSYNIYFHDTPAKSLFEKERRAFSHGCVRLQQPAELAAFLLKDKPEWTREKIRAAMSRSADQWVTLEPHVPVFITYFTAWVDDAGVLHFADDIYGHDKRMGAHMFK